MLARDLFAVANFLVLVWFCVYQLEALGECKPTPRQARLV